MNGLINTIGNIVNKFTKIITNTNTNSYQMKTKYQISKLLFICLLISAMALVFTSCQSESGRRAKTKPVIERPVKMSPLFAGTVEYADTIGGPRIITLYAYAVDKYDAERIMCEQMLATDTCVYNISVNEVQSYNKPFKLQR
jgi:hypothetical protein